MQYIILYQSKFDLENLEERENDSLMYLRILIINMTE